MYYYISEAPRSGDERRALEKARALLTNLGIAGEFVTASPARTVEELAELGAAKKYSTIVALGSERLINQVGTLLAGTPYVFGALPLDNPACLELITGVTSLEEAAEALKYRRVKLVPVMRIEPNKYYITEIRIHLNRSLPVTLTIDGARIEASVSDLRLAGTGQVLLMDRYATHSRLAQVWRWFRGRKEVVRYDSVFHGREVTIETGETLPVHLGHEVLAKTPLAATLIPNSLKIISKRDRVAAVEDEAIAPIGRKQYQTTNG